MNVGDSKDAAGYLQVIGEVENQDDIPSTYTQVTGTLYDINGKVIYLAFTYTDPIGIPVAGRNGFKITVGSDERSYRITRYNLTAESENSRFTSVPETPWPILALAAGLTLAVVALRRKESG